MNSLLRSPGSLVTSPASCSAPARPALSNASVVARFARVAKGRRAPSAPGAQPPGSSSGSGGDKDDTAATAAKVDKVIEELKKTGMTAVRAKQILKTWAEIGVKDPEQLKKVLVQRSLAPIPSLAAQGLLDAVASFGGFYLGGLAAQGEDFPFRIGVEVLGYFFGLYYFVQCLLEVGAIGGLLFSTYRYGTNSAALLSAVQTMAGPASGLNVLDKASRVVNIFKVVTALETVAAMLRDEYENPPRGDSLRNLGAYLTLSQAKESLGFKPEAYGLSEKEAGNIAYAFATYDTNQNFRLEPSELGVLCQSLGKEFDDDELKEAVKILDANNTGYIEFNEFVNWWVKKNPAAQQQPGAASA